MQAHDLNAAAGDQNVCFCAPSILTGSLIMTSVVMSVYWEWVSVPETLSGRQWVKVGNSLLTGQSLNPNRL